MSGVEFRVEASETAFEAEAWVAAFRDGRAVARRPVLEVPRDQGLDDFFRAEVGLLEAVVEAINAACTAGDVARAVLPLADLVTFANDHADIPDPSHALRPREAPALPHRQDPQGA